MKISSMSEKWIVCLVIIGILAFFGAALAVDLYLKGVGCGSKWKDSGMQSRYGVIEGCMVQRKDGTWIPSDSFREVGN